jgi:hypothetical protein
MSDKVPVLLVVLVDTARLRWFVAMVNLDGQTLPLLCSEEGDLEKYRGLGFDEQVAFLRHRFCGVLQRGCDRIWARNSRATQFVFLFDELLPEPTGTLTQAFAEHLTCWLLNPPVAVFRVTGAACAGRVPRLDSLAGQLDHDRLTLLSACLSGLLAARQNPEAWELARKKGT